MIYCAECQLEFFRIVSEPRSVATGLCESVSVPGAVATGSSGDLGSKSDRPDFLTDVCRWSGRYRSRFW